MAGYDESSYYVSSPDIGPTPDIEIDLDKIISHNYKDKL
jgi:hypothetical protein